jgi:hypothetical protein
LSLCPFVPNECVGTKIGTKETISRRLCDNQQEIM